MIFLHGGILCPAELAALAASMPFALAVFHWARCRIVTWWKGKLVLHPSASERPATWQQLFGRTKRGGTDGKA